MSAAVRITSVGVVIGRFETEIELKEILIHLSPQNRSEPTKRN